MFFLVVLILSALLGIILIMTTKQETKKNRAKWIIVAVGFAVCLASIFVGILLQNIAAIIGLILINIVAVLISVFWLETTYQKNKRKIPKRIIIGAFLLSVGAGLILGILFTSILLIL